MSDRHSHLRDRTMVLRVLVPSLQAALRDKISEMEEEAAKRASESQSSGHRPGGHDGHSGAGGGGGSSGGGGGSSGRAPTSQVLDLDGVSCEPTSDGSTLWSFRCDGASYPARLVNLPCPVEIHKTNDRATYYKSADVGQILIVYEDETHMEEAESVPGYRTEGYPSYYHSGLTPPMKRVVERRFAAREHRSAPPRSEVAAVERELRDLIDTISKDTKSKGGRGGSQNSASGGGGGAAKVLEEVVEEVVEYEPWMDDNGRQPYGVEFDEKDVMCTKHPEVWLDPADVKEEEKKREEEARRRKAEAEAEAANAAAMGGVRGDSLSSGGGAASGGKAAPAKVKSRSKKSSSSAASGPASVASDVSSAAVRADASPPAPAAAASASTTTTTTKKKKKKKKESKNPPSSPTPGDGHKKGIASKKTREVDEVTQVATQIAKGLDNGEDAELLALDDFFDFSAEGDDTFAGMDLS